jgi:4-amino-4-deoxy-L-arabinose transferase-like glycosyltransferase
MQKSIRPLHRLAPILILLLCALSIRLIDLFVMLGQQPNIFSVRDADGYVTIARNLVESGAYSRGAKPDLSPDLTRPPLYPLFLTALMQVFGENGNLIVLFHIILGTILVILTYAIARELKISPWFSFLGSILIALDPLFILTGHYYLSENLFLPIWIAGLWLFIRYWNSRQLAHLLLCAMLFALAALTRPVLQYFPILIIILALSISRPQIKAVFWRNFVLFALVFVMLLLPWCLRNQTTGGVFTLSTISDINLYYYRAKSVLADSEQISQDKAMQQLEGEIDSLTARKSVTPGQVHAYMRFRSVEIFASYPLQTLKMTAFGAARLLLDPGFSLVCTGLDPNNLTMECFPGEGTMLSGNLFQLIASRFRTMSLIQKIALIWSIVLMVGLYVGYLTGLAVAWREKQWFVLGVTLLSVQYFVVISSGAESLYRLRMPFVPVLAVVSAYALSKWRPKRS